MNRAAHPGIADLLAGYGAAAIAMLALDAAWLSLAVPKLYRPYLGELLLETPRLAPAILFYAIYLAGVVLFAVLPGLAAGSLRAAAGRGAAFGFCAYGTYDLTNHATLREWSAAITIADMAWGSVLTALAACAGTAAALRYRARRGARA